MHVPQMLILSLTALLAVGCGSGTYQVTSEPGNSASVAGISIKVEPGGDDISVATNVEDKNDISVTCGDVFIQLDAMRLSVSKAEHHSNETMKDYGDVTVGDEVLIQNDVVLVNSEVRQPITP